MHFRYPLYWVTLILCCVQDLIKIIIEWINDELVDERIIIQDIEEDLYDGQVGGFLSFSSGFFP